MLEPKFTAADGQDEINTPLVIDGPRSAMLPTIPEDALLPPPPRNDHNISPWIDEQIWGHRLWDSQSTWLLFLEFLTVAECCHREGRLFDEAGVFYPLAFRPYKRMFLRNILFNSDALVQIAERQADSDAAWVEWLRWMRNHARGMINPDFSYLKIRFHSFHDFTSLVGMLRSSAVESQSNKRWTSRFVFPFGPMALYEDLNLGPTGSPVRDNINFGRTGELLYLMLCRCRQREALQIHLSRVLEAQNPWNQLLGLLQPGPDQDTSERGRSYLPYRYHFTYDALGQDWLSIFELGLPGFEGYVHLVALAGLHVLLYQLTLAAQWSCRTEKVRMICEMVAPKKTLVRELSFANYLDNNSLTSRALEDYLERIERSPEWQHALLEPVDFASCRQILEVQVGWPRDPDDYVGPRDPAVLMAELRTVALKRHRQHAANIHRSYGRGAGLVSRRGTNRMRYAPTDALLKTLLCANVQKRMEFGEFLALLYQRYGLVFGEREAEQALTHEDYDKKAFQANSRRLEQRLQSLGLLRRLSDACAYVENPFYH